jgi:hypothetical protein
MEEEVNLRWQARFDSSQMTIKNNRRNAGLELDATQK